MLPLFTLLFLIIWFILANYFGYRSSLRLLNLLTLASIPLLIGILIILFSKPLRTLLKDIPTHWLISLQIYRTLGLMFLYLYFHEGFVSKGFALFAGIGDIFIGVTALPVSNIVKKQKEGYRLIAMVWNLGIADLIIAPVSAVLFGNKGLNYYPLVLVPLFIGPPLSILLHIASLRNFLLNKKRQGIPFHLPVV